MRWTHIVIISSTNIVDRIQKVGKMWCIIYMYIMNVLYETVDLYFNIFQYLY